MKRKYSYSAGYGYTLIELLLVITLVTIIGYSFAAIGTRFMTVNYLQNSTNDVISALRTSQLNAMSSKYDSNWGVAIIPGKIIIFSGNSYAGRDISKDTSYPLPSSVSVTNTEVIFHRVTGNTNIPVQINLSNEIGESAQVNVSSIGVVDLN